MKGWILSKVYIMKKYFKPTIYSYQVEFEDILETSLSDLSEDIFGFDVDPDEVV